MSTPALATALVIAAVIYLLAASALAAMARAIAWVWKRLGARGRLVALIAGAWPLSHLGSELGLVPEGWTADSVSAGFIVAGAGLGLLWLRRSGQREWRESGGRAFGVHAGLRETADGCAVRYSANAGRLEALELRVAEHDELADVVLAMLAEHGLSMLPDDYAPARGRGGLYLISGSGDAAS